MSEHDMETRAVRKWKTPALFAAIGGLLMLASFFLPWIGVQGKKTKSPVISIPAHVLIGVSREEAPAEVVKGISLTSAARSLKEEHGLGDEVAAKTLMSVLLDAGLLREQEDFLEKVSKCRMAIRELLFRDKASRIKSIIEDAVDAECAGLADIADDFLFAVEVIGEVGEERIMNGTATKRELLHFMREKLSPAERKDLDETVAALDSVAEFLRGFDAREIVERRVTKMEVMRRYAETLPEYMRSPIRDSADDIELLFGKVLHHLGDHKIIEGHVGKRDAIARLCEVIEKHCGEIGNQDGKKWREELEGAMKLLDGLLSPLREDVIKGIVENYPPLTSSRTQTIVKLAKDRPKEDVERLLTILRPSRREDIGFLERLLRSKDEGKAGVLIEEHFPHLDDHKESLAALLEEITPEEAWGLVCLMALVHQEEASLIVEHALSRDALEKRMVDATGVTEEEKRKSLYESARRILDSLLLLTEVDVKDGVGDVVGDIYLLELGRLVQTQELSRKITKLDRYFESIKKLPEMHFACTPYGRVLPAFRRDQLHAKELFEEIKHERLLGRAALVLLLYDELVKVGRENLVDEKFSSAIVDEVLFSWMTAGHPESWGDFLLPYFMSPSRIEDLFGIFGYDIPMEIWLPVRARTFDAWFFNEDIIRAYANALPIDTRDRTLRVLDDMNYLLEIIHELGDAEVTSGKVTKWDALSAYMKKMSDDVKRTLLNEISVVDRAVEIVIRERLLGLKEGENLDLGGDLDRVEERLTERERESLKGQIEILRGTIDALRKGEAGPLVEGNAGEWDAFWKVLWALGCDDRSELEAELDRLERTMAAISKEKLAKVVRGVTFDKESREHISKHLSELSEDERPPKEKIEERARGIVEGLAERDGLFSWGEGDISKALRNILVEETPTYLRTKAQIDDLFLCLQGLQGYGRFMEGGRVPDFARKVLRRNLLMAKLAGDQGFAAISEMKRRMAVKVKVANDLFDLLRESGRGREFVREKLAKFVSSYFENALGYLHQYSLRDRGRVWEECGARKGMVGLLRDVDRCVTELSIGRDNRRDWRLEEVLDNIPGSFLLPSYIWGHMRKIELKLLASELVLPFRYAIEGRVKAATGDAKFVGALRSLIQDRKFLTELERRIRNINRQEIEQSIADYTLKWFDESVQVVYVSRILGHKNVNARLLTEGSRTVVGLSPVAVRAFERGCDYFGSDCVGEGQMSGAVFDFSDITVKKGIKDRVASALAALDDPKGAERLLDFYRAVNGAGMLMIKLRQALVEGTGRWLWCTGIPVLAVLVLLLTMISLVYGKARGILISIAGGISTLGMFLHCHFISSVPGAALAMLGLGPAVALVSLFLICIGSFVELRFFSMKRLVVMLGFFSVFLGFFLPWAAETNDPSIAWKTGWGLVKAGFSLEVFWGYFPTWLLVVFPVVAFVCVLVTFFVRRHGLILFLLSALSMGFLAGISYAVEGTQLGWGFGVAVSLSGFAMMFVANMIREQTTQQSVTSTTG